MHLHLDAARRAYCDGRYMRSCALPNPPVPVQSLTGEPIASYPPPTRVLPFFSLSHNLTDSDTVAQGHQLRCSGARRTRNAHSALRVCQYSTLRPGVYVRYFIHRGRRPQKNPRYPGPSVGQCTLDLSTAKTCPCRAGHFFY